MASLRSNLFPHRHSHIAYPYLAVAFFLLPIFTTAQTPSATPIAQPDAPVPVPLKLVTHPYGNATAYINDLFSGNFLHYQQAELPSIHIDDSLGDPVRADLLVHGNEIRLSLRDAIALALENNLDIESVRLLRPMAQADMARARSGQLLRNLPSAVDSGSASAAGTLATASPFGFEGNSQPGGILSGLIVQLAGSPIPNTEPVLFATGKVFHNNQPQANQAVTGTSFLNTKEEDWQIGVRKGYFTGTDLTFKFDALRTSQNAPFNSINPYITGDASVRIDQHLLQGFGRTTNRRAIYIARNNATIADLTFRQQVILTVSQVLGLYYDLVSFQQQEQVVATAAERSKKRLVDAQRRVDMGLISLTDLLDARIAVTAGQQALTDAQAQIAAQEATLKSIITHAGLQDFRIMRAHIVPTDTFSAPPINPNEDPEAAAKLALERRSELAQGNLSMANKRLSLLGARNALRPTFDAYVSLENNALAGQLNRLAPGAIQATTTPANIGGFGTVLDQLTRRTYPDYEVGFQLNVPLINRAAQSDLARAQIDQREQEISQQALRNGIRLQAIKSALALKQARSQYELSVDNLRLYEQNLSDVQKMFEFGSSDPEHLQAAQDSFDRAKLKEITSRNTYARATVNLQAVLDQTLDANDIVLEPPATTSSNK